MVEHFGLLARLDGLFARLDGPLVRLDGLHRQLTRILFSLVLTEDLACSCPNGLSLGLICCGNGDLKGSGVVGALREG